MSRQQKITIDVPVAIGFVILIIILASTQIYLVPSSKKPESTTKGQLITHYVGDAALELPESWIMESIQTTFYLTNQENGPRISFQETPAKAGQDADKELANKLKSLALNKSVDVRSASFGRTDISEALGRPAMILIRETRPNSFGLRVVSAYTYFPPPGDKLEMTLELATPHAKFIFTYIEAANWPSNEDKLEIVADKQKVFTDWALTFINSFQYIGSNISQSRGFLATKFGRVDIRNKAEYQHYVLTARFYQNEANAPRVSDISFSLSSLPTEAPSCGRDTGKRKPARPLGCEVKKITTELNTERLDLTWQNCSTKRRFSPQDPSFSIAYCGYAVDQDVLEEAGILSMWDSLINSLRILSNSN